MYELALLGEVQLRDSAGRAVPLRRHARAILTMLALEPTGSRSRRSIAGVIWAGRDTASALLSLRQALNQIRQGCAGSLRADKEMLHLDRNVVASDIDKIEASDDPAWLATMLERCGSQALDGIELDGAFKEWTVAQRAALEARLSQHVQTLLDNKSAADPGASRLADIWRRVQPVSAVRPALASAAAPPVPDRPPAPPQPVIHEAAPPLLIVTPVRLTGVAAEGPPLGNVTAELLLRLSRFSELRVVEADLSEAPAVGTAFALAASIHGPPETRRMIVRLMTTPGEEIIWADRIALDDDVDLHLDRLAGRIACSMVLEDDPHLDCAAAAAGSTYARFIEYRMRALWPASHAEALDAEMGLRAIIRENPRFTFAYLALSRLLNTDYAYTRASSGMDKRDEALALAKSALALDRTMSATWLHVGFSLLRRHEWATAKSYIDQAVQLNSNDHTKLNVAATLYLYIGDLQKSEQLLQRSLEFMRVPNGDYMSDLGLLRLVQGRYLEAYDALMASPRPLLFTHVYLAVAARLGGRECQDIVADCRRRLTPIFGGGFEPGAKAIGDWIAAHHPFRDPAPREMLRNGILEAFG